MHVVNTLAPVFLVIALGAALRKRGVLNDAVSAGLKTIAYWVGLPCLLFAKLAGIGQIGPAAGRVMLMVAAGVAGAAGLAVLVAWLIKLPGRSVGTFVQASFRGNLAFVGLPVLLYAFGGDGSTTAAEAEAVALLALGPLVVLHNALAVIALLASQHRIDAAAVGKMARQVATNPLLLACVAGLAWSLGPWDLPGPISRTLGVIGQFTLPAALLCIGSALVATPLKGHVWRAVPAAGLKLAIAPLAGLLAGWLLGAGAMETSVALIMLACPTAVASYVLADQLGGDSDLAAATVVVSTILSIFSLAGAVATI